LSSPQGKKPPRVESEEEEEEKEEEEDKDDLEFDNLSKKDMIKIKRLIEIIEEQEFQLEQQEEYLIGKIEELISRLNLECSLASM
jgi:Txe/YoeB family toxin of Txe-Axe toxin-antitoxin module